MSNTHIILREFLKNDFAVSTEMGEKLFDKIKVHLDNNEVVELDFQGITVVITAFLNAAIGALYNNMYTEEFLEKHLHYSNVSTSSKSYIDLVIETAKKYFSNEKMFDKNTDDLLND